MCDVAAADLFSSEIIDQRRVQLVLMLGKDVPASQLEQQ